MTRIHRWFGAIASAVLAGFLFTACGTSGPSSTVLSGFCSTMHSITSYGEHHAHLTSLKEMADGFGYTERTLSAARSVPSDIKSTVSTTIVTSREIHGLLAIVVKNGTTTAAQERRAASLDEAYGRDVSILAKWSDANC